MKSSSISGRRDCASTSRRAWSASSPSVRQSTLWSSVSSGTTPFATPATYAVETCTRQGREPLSITPRYRFMAPNRLVWNPSSIGGSNDTVAAEWIAMSMSPGSCGTPREKSPSTIVTRSSKRARSPSSPMRPRRTSNAGLRKRYSTRSRDVEPVCERTNRTIRPSGTSPSNRSKMTCPRNPVTPVSKIVLPVRRSTIEGAAPPAAFSTMRQIITYLPDGRQASRSRPARDHPMPHGETLGGSN